MTNHSIKGKTKSIYLACFFVLLGWIVLFAICLVILLGYQIGAPALSLTSLGVFGDSFGIINSLFSGFALIAIYATYVKQKQELVITQVGLKQQQFESTFFHLVNLHHQLVNDLRVSNYSSGQARGREVFGTLYSWFSSSFLETDEIYFGTVDEVRKCVQEKYDFFYKNSRSILGHYFRNLYHIVVYVDQSDIEDKRRYIQILRAQLSSSEQLLLFYNSLSEYGEKFKPLIEKYALLHEMPINELLDCDHQSAYRRVTADNKIGSVQVISHSNFFQSSAYGD